MQYKFRGLLLFFVCCLWMQCQNNKVQEETFEELKSRMEALEKEKEGHKSRIEDLEEDAKHADRNCESLEKAHNELADYVEGVVTLNKLKEEEKEEEKEES